MHLFSDPAARRIERGATALKNSPGAQRTSLSGEDLKLSPLRMPTPSRAKPGVSPGILSERQDLHAAGGPNGRGMKHRPCPRLADNDARGRGMPRFSFYR